MEAIAEQTEVQRRRAQSGLSSSSIASSTRKGNGVFGGGRGIERHTEVEALDIIKAELSRGKTRSVSIRLDVEDLARADERSFRTT